MPCRGEAIAAWAAEFDWRYGAELGVADGATLAILMASCPNLYMIGVDVWSEQGARPGKTFSNEKCRCVYCAETKESRRRLTMAQREANARSIADKSGRATLFRATTSEIAPTVAGGSLDFVFIDADHSFEGVSTDIANWRPKVRLGGRLIGHDFNMASVRAAVFATFAEADVSTDDDHLWWVSL